MLKPGLHPPTLCRGGGRHGFEKKVAWRSCGAFPNGGGVACWLLCVGCGKQLPDAPSVTRGVSLGVLGLG